MTQLGEAVARYHKILEGEGIRNSGWLSVLREKMASSRLVVNGRPVSPVLRPHFLSRRQYTNLVKTSESLNAAIDRVRALALANPAVMSRLEMLPAEKMLAAVDPGYSVAAVASLLDTQVNNGSLHMTGSQTDLPSGVVYGEMLSRLFYDSAPVKDFRKKYKLTKTSGSKPLVAAMLRAWKEFGGKRQPRIAIVEFRQIFETLETQESHLLAELLRGQGYETLIVSPDQVEYRNGVLRSGDFEIDLVYRNLRAHEFLMRFDLTHPLVRAYRERRVCVVNSFRTELTRKRALLALLTDDSVTGSFPAIERKAIRESIPWTRVVTQGRTTGPDAEAIDIPAYISANRASLVLLPNDDTNEDLAVWDGSRLDDAMWDRAIRTALRHPYVVQSRIQAYPVNFPVEVDGDVVYRDLNVEVHPHTFLGRVHGCSARISAFGGGYSNVSGVAPTFILESK